MCKDQKDALVFAKKCLIDLSDAKSVNERLEKRKFGRFLVKTYKDIDVLEGVRFVVEICSTTTRLFGLVSETSSLVFGYHFLPDGSVVENGIGELDLILGATDV